ncbi:RNA methyltransferase [bacterium]|nr:RNA methyltransferase [bacterium]
MQFIDLGRHSRLIKEIKSLAAPQDRRKCGLFAAEGIRVVEEALKSPLQIDSLIFAESLEGSAICRKISEYAAEREEVKVFRAADDIFQRLVQTKSDQGVLALVHIPKAQKRHLRACRRVLALSGVQDPGNVGTLIRSASAFHFDSVLIFGGADPFNSKAVRSSAGAVFHIETFYLTEGEAPQWRDYLLELGFRFVTAEAHDGESLHSVSFPEPMALILGAEVKGVDSIWQDSAHLKVHIPIGSSSESLNVGVAGSIIMYEADRAPAAD